MLQPMTRLGSTLAKSTSSVNMRRWDLLKVMRVSGKRFMTHSSHTTTGNPFAEGSELTRKNFLSISSLSPALQTLAQNIHNGNRVALSRALTLVESNRSDHREASVQLLTYLQHLQSQLFQTLQQPTEPISIQHATGSIPVASPKRTIRIGISGSPGVGKSTFIEQLGLIILRKLLEIEAPESSRSTSKPLRDTSSASPTPSQSPSTALLSVLTIDPSSLVTGGSILGDRTRMPQLCAHPHAYIRPSPNKATLGGTHAATCDSITLCEYGGAEVIVVETVGVGQSEVKIKEMVDCFVVLIGPGAGDELQGMKKGIIEMADIVCITKADGDTALLAKQTRKEYKNAIDLLYMLRGRDENHDWKPQVLTCSSINGGEETVGKVWDMICKFDDFVTKNGAKETLRRDQRITAYISALSDEFSHQFLSSPQKIANNLRLLAKDLVANRDISSRGAAMRTVSTILSALERQGL